MEGRLILDRFLLEEELGRGGYGTVYRARDRRLERDVAVKVLEHGPSSRRLMREAQAAARLNHRSIVTLYEIGEDSDAAYLVSELVDGESMRELLGRGELSDRAVAEAGAEVCEALEHAHERGVVHRDLKPENVAIARWEDSRAGPWSRQRPDRAMLMDFGVASIAGAAEMTRTGEVVGTLAYMAPEQAEGEPAGPPADAYSLALVLYEAWSGSNPVARSSPAATARAIGAPVPSLAKARPDLPYELATTVDACLEPDPDERPTLNELRDELNLARPGLDAAEPRPSGLPLLAPGRPSLRRTGAVAALFAGLAALAWGADRGGLALVLAVLLLPGAVLFARARDWLMPAAAPLLGLAGLAPLYPAIAGLAGGVRRCAALGLAGWCWLAVAATLSGRTLLLAPAVPPTSGWEASPALAAGEVLLPLLDPASLAGAALWSGSAALLAALLAARSVVTRAVGALLWGAAAVALHGLLVGVSSEPASPALAAALAAILLAAVWAHSGGPRPRRTRRRGEPAGPALAPGAR